MSVDRGMYLSRHRDIEKLSRTMTANIRSFTLPLAQDLPRIGHIDGFLFFSSEGLDLPRRSFCAFCHQTLTLAGTTRWPCLWSGGPHGEIPPAPVGPLRYPHAFGLPAAPMHQGVVPTALQSHSPVHPAPQKASWRLQGTGAAG